MHPRGTLARDSQAGPVIMMVILNVLKSRPSDWHSSRNCNTDQALLKELEHHSRPRIKHHAGMPLVLITQLLKTIFYSIARCSSTYSEQSQTASQSYSPKTCDICLVVSSGDRIILWSMQMIWGAALGYDTTRTSSHPHGSTFIVGRVFVTQQGSPFRHANGVPRAAAMLEEERTGSLLSSMCPGERENPTCSH
jgi:hypothetical protein